MAKGHIWLLKLFIYGVLFVYSTRRINLGLFDSFCSLVCLVGVFGLYSGTIVMTNVFRMKNYPSEYVSLMKDIDAVKLRLANKGYTPK